MSISEGWKEPPPGRGSQRFGPPSILRIPNGITSAVSPMDSARRICASDTVRRFPNQ